MSNLFDTKIFGDLQVTRSIETLSLKINSNTITGIGGNGTATTISRSDHTHTASSGGGDVTGLGTAAFKDVGTSNGNVPVLDTNGKLNTTVMPAYVSSLSGGTTGLTPNTATSGAITLSGTLGVANGGTGATTLTGIVKGNGTSAFTAMTGTTSYVARWTDANTIGTGILYDNATRAGVGITSPTAFLHLKAGAAAASSAPLKFTSGINLTAVELGAMEFDGNNLYFTVNVASTPTRKIVTWSDHTHSYEPSITNGSANQIFGMNAAGNAKEWKTFSIGSTGTAPAYVHTANTVTLNIPSASGTGVTSGTISKTDYDKIHSQNTDTGTTSQTFHIDSDGTGPKLKNNGGVLEIRNSTDADFADLTVNNLIVKGTTLTVNSETITLDDNVLMLNNNATDATKSDGGINVYRGTSYTAASLIWSESNQKWMAGLAGAEVSLSLEGHTHGTDVGAGGGTITGILPIANGGTGTSTTTAWGIVYGASGATAYGTTAAGTSGQVLVSKGNAAPQWATLDMTYMPDSAFKKSVKAASTANLTVTATTTTLTNAGTKAALTLDGVTLAVGDRVLIKDQTAQAQNGIYTVTTVGTASVNWVLTRAASADSSSEIAGGMVNIDQGTQGGFMWSNNFKTTDTLGTTAMPWYRVYSTFDAATAATANKLALRDGSGNITAADFKVGTESVWRAGNHPAPINERYVISVGGVTKWTAITIPNSKTYVVGGKQLVVYRDGIRQSLDSSSTAKDNDYWEVSTTQVRFNYSIPTGSVIEFRIIPL